MTLGAVDLLFNLAVMLFWMRAWESNRQTTLPNPYLDGVRNFTQPVLDALAHFLPGRSTRLAAVCCWLGLIVFRGLALPLANPDAAARMWQIQWGYMVFTPRVAPAWPAAGGIIFSLASFAAFLFQVWILALLYTTVRQPERPAEFLNAMAEPWSSRPGAARPASILAGGAAAVGLLYFAAGGAAAPEPSFWARPTWWIMRELVNGLACAANVLTVLRSLMLILLIGTWVALFGGGETMMAVCRDWLDFLLGPFRRFRLQVAMFDLTPIIAYMALGLAHFLLYGYALRMVFFIVLQS